MIKVMTIFILILNIKLAYAETKVQKKIQNLAKESKNMSKEILLNKILALRADAMSELYAIIESHKYRIDDVIYLTDVDTTLDALPSEIEGFPSCENLKGNITSTFQRSWKNLPKAALDFWVILKKICK